MSWVTTSSTVAYENPWIRVRHDEVTRPDGGDGIYGVVETRNPAVFIVALNEQDEVLLVRVDRYTTGLQWEVPAGSTDGEDPRVAGERELREESGYAADRWRQVGEMWAMNGVCRAKQYVFVATDLRHVGGHEQEDEGISESRWVPWSEVIRMISAGEIQDGETVSSLMFAAVATGRL